MACPGSATAGDDDLTTSLCGGTFTLSDLLSGDAADGGIWMETTSSGSFDEMTTVFDSDGLTAGVYEFIYVVDDCSGDLDTAFFSINVGGGESAGDDNTETLCNMGGTLDLNTLTTGGRDYFKWKF